MFINIDYTICTIAINLISDGKLLFHKYYLQIFTNMYFEAGICPEIFQDYTVYPEKLQGYALKNIKQTMPDNLTKVKCAVSGRAML